MPINKDVILKWDGKEYPIKITFGMIDECEAKHDLNLIILLQQVRNGDVRLTQIAKLFKFLFEKGGLNVEVETVFEALFGSGKFDVKEVKAMMAGIFDAIFPEPKKKVSTQTKKTSKTKLKKG